MQEQAIKTEKHADTMLQIISENMALKQQIQALQTEQATMKEQILQELKAEQQARWLDYLAAHPEVVKKSRKAE